MMKGKILAALALAALAGCDGSGSGPPPVVPAPTPTPAPTPAPTPTPTPTPTPEPYQTAFDFSRDRKIPMLLFHCARGPEGEVSSTLQPYVTDELNFTREPVTDNVRITYTFGDFVFGYSPQSTNVLYNLNNDILRADTNTGPNSRRALMVYPVPGMQYVAVGEGVKPAVLSAYFEEMVLGSRTLPADAPAGAILTYAISPESDRTLTGSGVVAKLKPSGEIIVNVGTGVVSGTISVPSVTGGSPVVLTISGALNASDLSLSGSVANNVALPAGTFGGWLFGPSAVETGILIQLPNSKIATSYFFPAVGKRTP